jgi:hypothetical protein
MAQEKPMHKASHEQMRDLSARLVGLEQELHRLGMHATARATNRAVRVIGWEFVGDLASAREAARSDVP